MKLFALKLFTYLYSILPMQLKRGDEQLNEEGTQILQEYQ